MDKDKSLYFKYLLNDFSVWHADTDVVVLVCLFFNCLVLYSTPVLVKFQFVHGNVANECK